jgi:3-ketosteroid 9alpha-monooxygenase subunit B
MSRPQYHPLRVLKVVDETHDSRSISFEIPAELREKFRYKPGQHLQLHVPCGARPLPRCYSLTSIPGADEPLRVTVKRVADGRGSNWLCENLKAGDTLEVMPPAGVFTLRAADANLLMFAGGSGITPVFSLIRSALATGRGSIRLVYANRDERSVIFGAELARLAREHPQRLHVIHWLDSVQGFPSQAQLAALARGYESSECFICGPGVFMDASAAALRDVGVPNNHIHIERFVSLPEDADDVPVTNTAPPTSAEIVEIEVELDGVTHKVPGRSGELLIESLEAAGLQPPFSCRSGACAACMCHLDEGDVELVHNHVLSDDEMRDGWVLSCQALPLTPRVRIRYPA